MLNKICLALCLIAPSIAMAAPEIKGSPEEIGQYLSGIPKVVSINASADQMIASNEARMSLLVNTGSKKLSDALKKNYDTRNNLKKQLKALGIKDSSINESKFSSTPEYGMFGDEPKSYNVSNVISVSLSSEEQMISIAGISDGNANIRYLSTRPMTLDKEKIQAELFSKAIQKAKDKASKYESELNVTLVPVNIQENTMGVFDENLNQQKRMSKISSLSYGKENAFGSKKLNVSVTIQYKLMPN